jgi:uncharacterized protein (DUF1501 family)
MRRRAFLHGCALAAAAAPFRLWALPAPGPRFVFVLLRGGCDAASVLVPYRSGVYYDWRPGIAIARPGNGPDAADRLDDTWGLHPALRDSVLPLYRAGQAVFVPYAGSQDQSRSHFHAQDVIELGQDYGPRIDYGSGFLNRAAEVLSRGAPRTGMSFTDDLPLAFKGRVTVANVGLRHAAKSALNDRQAGLIEQMYQGTSFAGQVREGIGARRQASEALQQEMTDSARGAVNAKGFAQEARRMARLMLENPACALAFIDVGGWDTHVGQGGARGQLADRLRGLGEGLGGFAQELGPAWRDTVVVVVSEFGRTVRENGNKGTDHGHGNVMWVLGGGIAGGRIVGEQVDLAAHTLFQNRDLPVLNEYRTLTGYVLARQYALSSADLDYVFPGAKAARYPFL